MSSKNALRYAEAIKIFGHESDHLFTSSSPKPLNSAILTQMEWLGFFIFSSTIVPNFYAATGNQTYRRVASGWDL